MADFTQAYRHLRAFSESLSYTEFSTVSYSLITGVLQKARVTAEQEVYIVDEPPYTTPAIELRFQLVQDTGHKNQIRLTFTEQGKLVDFHLRTTC
ncbi:MAG: hypothetical protein EOO60_08390 [Hymenobacter sp.]|nr:MAG: hypothetical protein EOO60_08390 [Hymenobacter sp.]